MGSVIADGLRSNAWADYAGVSRGHSTGGIDMTGKG